MSFSPDGTTFSLNIFNPIFASSYDSGADLLTNGGFETAGGGGADVFGTWVENTDSGNLTLTQATATPDPNSGTYYCEMYSVNATGVGHVYQDVTVTAGSYYRLSLYSRLGTIYADQQGRIAVYDNSNTEWIISKEPTGLFSSTEWQQGTHFFTAPPGCSSVRIYLYQSVISDTYVHYDDVKLELLQPGELALVSQANDQINSYRHSISANVGFDEMTFTTSGDMRFLEDWMENGLGRHIVVNESGGGVIWEGFVDELDMRVGSFRMNIGPMLDIINRARVTFNELDYAGLSPVGGDQVVTQWYDDAVSMGRYGVLEGILTGGDGRTEDMYALVASLLPEIAWPPSESSFSISGSSGNLEISVTCKGYGHLLNKYYYSQQSVAGTQAIDAKMKAVLRGSPNNIFKFTDTSIEVNLKEVGVFEDGQKTAMTLFKEMANLGGTPVWDTSTEDRRFVFGVFEDRLFQYWSIKNDVVFTTRLMDGRIERVDGGFPDPWRVRPGVWLLVEDAFVGRLSRSVRPSEDPRLIFMESVQYSAPYGLSIKGGRASTFLQRLERLGIGGI
jgi:hypothetical protein